MWNSVPFLKSGGRFIKLAGNHFIEPAEPNRLTPTLKPMQCMISFALRAKVLHESFIRFLTEATTNKNIARGTTDP